ncbi:YciC family protein [Candidatus Gillettellia adelgis]
MPITANILYCDSFNFFRNQLTSIVMLALLTALISMLLNQAFSTDVEMLKIMNITQGDFATSSGVSVQEFIQKMTPEEQLMMLKALAVATFSALIGYALLIGGILTLLRLVSQGQRTSALCAIVGSAPALPRLFLLLFICSVLIQLGLRLCIVPGVIMAIAFSLASIIITTDKKGVFDSMKLSCQIAFVNVRVIVPAMALWLAAKLLLLFVLSQQSLLTPNAAHLVLTVLSNLISALLLIYLFRLYMLLHSEL